MAERAAGHRVRLAPPHLLRLRARGRGPLAGRGGGRRRGRGRAPGAAGRLDAAALRRRGGGALRPPGRVPPAQVPARARRRAHRRVRELARHDDGQRRGPAGQDARRARPGEHGRAGDALSRSWTARSPSRGCTRSARTRSCAGSPESRRPGCSSPPAPAPALSALSRSDGEELLLVGRRGPQGRHGRRHRGALRGRSRSSPASTGPSSRSSTAGPRRTTRPSTSSPTSAPPRRAPTAC